MINLKEIIEKYPECLDNANKLKGIIFDLYPQEKKGIVNVLVTILDCGIVAEMKQLTDVSQLEISKWQNQLSDDFCISENVSLDCITEWLKVFDLKFDKKANSSLKNGNANTNQQEEFEEVQGNLSDWKVETVNGENQVSFIGFDCEDVVIPNIVEGKEIKVIAKDCFNNCKTLKSVKIPFGIEKIGYGAFYGCSSLKTIDIPDSVVSIGEHAFSFSGIEKIEIPKNVTSIERDTFSWCRSLTSVTIGNNVETIEWDAFDNCSALIYIVIPDSVKTIEMGAFSGCSSLNYIVMGKNIVDIDNHAFTSSFLSKDMVFYCHRGSYALQWARKNGYTVKDASLLDKND